MYLAISLIGLVSLLAVPFAAIMLVIAALNKRNVLFYSFFLFFSLVSYIVVIAFENYSSFFVFIFGAFALAYLRCDFYQINTGDKVVKKSKVMFICSVLGLMYTIYIIYYFIGVNAQSSGLTEVLGGALATALVLPHIVLVLLATIFAIIAFFLISKGFSITAGILYSVGGVMFLPYIFFVIPMVILSFAGAVMSGKIHIKENAIIINAEVC